MNPTEIAVDDEAPAVERVRSRLLQCVNDLDALDLHHSAALVSMAIDRLGPQPGDPAPFD